MNSLVILLVTISLLHTPPSLYAVESTPSAETIQKSLQDRIKRAVKENLNGEKPITQRLKAFFGSVVTISGDTITIQRHQNEALMTYQVTIDKDTKIVKSKSSDLKLENISVSDNIIAMGLTSDDQTMTAKRLVIKNDQDTIKKTAFEANVLELDLKKKSIVYSQNDTTATDILSRRIALYDSNIDLLTKAPELPSLAILVRLIDTEDDTNVITRVLFPFTGSPSATIRE